MKNRASASTHKKVVILLLNRVSVRGYLDPAGLGRKETADILTSGGEHLSIKLDDIKSIYFVREFTEPFEVTVVICSQRADGMIPFRTSFPSRLTP